MIRQVVALSSIRRGRNGPVVTPCMERGRIFGYDIEGFLWPVDIVCGNLSTDDPIYLRWVLISEGYGQDGRRRRTHARAILGLVEASKPWSLRAWRDLVTWLCRGVYLVGLKAGVW